MDEIVEEIARILREELGHARAVRLEDELARDLQLDSVGVLTLVVGLENKFRMALDEQDAVGVRTVADLVALVQRRRAHPEPRT